MMAKMKQARSDVGLAAWGPAFESFRSACVVDQSSAHRLRRRGDEVRSFDGTNGPVI